MRDVRLPEFDESQVVLIGVAEYDSQDMEDLPAIPRNLSALRDIFVDQGLSGYQESHVHSILNPPTVDQVMSPLLEIGKITTDVLVVYYAGHGLLVGESSDLHLSVRSSRPDAPWTTLKFGHFASVINESAARIKVVILDSCYSGRAQQDFMGEYGPTLIEEQLRIEGIYVMTSTSKAKRALAPRDSQYTAFTGELVGYFGSPWCQGDRRRGLVSAQ